MTAKLETARIFTPLMALLVAVGCGGGEDGGGAGGAAGGGAAAQVENPVDPATAGSIRGTVSFTGTPPAPESIDMSQEPTCADKHEGQPMKPLAVVGPDGELANVFVYVKSGLPDVEFPVTGDDATLDQNGCTYHPHIIALQTGQDLTVHNSDDVLHNVNATPEENRGFNRSQPTSGMEFSTSFAVPEVMIPVRCDVHGWMEAYIGVTDHPFHAVSAEDGTFALEQLPPGEYEVEAWHERYGTSTQTVTVPASGEAEVTFEFSEQMAGRDVPLAAPAYVDHRTGTIVRRPAGAGDRP